MAKYLIFFLISSTISLLITPLIRLTARKLNIVDLPSERKIHKKPVPLLGGIPIFFAFNLTIILGIIFNFEYFEKFYNSKWVSIFLCQFIILGIGIYDDIKRVRPGVKFFFQILAGSLLVLFGFGIPLLTNPFTGNSISLGILSIPLTIVWVVGITNALNLIDGLDGLAAGTAFIACITISGISFIYQNIPIAVVTLILAGSILGFLRYNFQPAKIFLGDSGSLFLGFLLSIFSLESTLKGATLVAVLVPILVLGLPIGDTLLSMIRRFLKPAHLVEYQTKNRKSNVLFFRIFSMFKSDNDHIHHRLMKLGFSQRKTVFILYGICFILCAFAFLNVAWKNLNTTLFLGAIVIASFIGIKSLQYKEFKIFKRGLFLPLSDLPLINKRFFPGIIDLFFILLAYYFSFLLIFKGFDFQVKALFIKTFPLVLILKIIIFYFSWLYKESWKYSSIEELIKLIRALAFSSIGSSSALILIFGTRSFGGIIFFIIDFFILLSFVAGSRILFRLIDYYYGKSNTTEGKKIIIYGAGRRGALLAKELQLDKNLNYHLCGFIDDDSQKKGKTQHSIPILGTLMELEDIIRTNKIFEVIISTKKIGKEKNIFLRTICSKNGIDLQLSELKINKIN